MVTYVTTDPTGRWTGTGSPILPAQVDENFYEVQNAIDNIELQTPVSIDSIEAQGTNMVITLSDNTQQIVAMPVPIYTSRGLWQSGVVFQVNDTFYYNQSAYFVNVAHTSVAPFNPAATNGLGNNLYTLIIDASVGSLPTGGAKGTILGKSSASDYAVSWQNSVNLPVYGATNISGVVTLDKANGECQRVSLIGDVTSLSISNFGLAGQCSKLVLEVWNTDDFTMAFPTGTIWPNGNAPTVSQGDGKKDVYILLTMDGGTTIYGTVVGKNFS